MPDALRLEDVWKGFGTGPARVEVLRGAELALPPGSLNVLMGPSGSGKSTLLGIAGLLENADRGRVAVGGRDAAPLSERERSALRATEIGMVFQKFFLMPGLGVLDNVLFRFRYSPPPRRPREEREAARAALDRVGLGGMEKRKAGVLSSGEMQRVAIARAIASSPRLLLADEPTGNLDEANTGAIMELFLDLNRAGATLLVVTHNPAWTRLDGARAYRMADGRVVKA